MAVKTSKVSGRRRLHFGSLDEVLAEAERLAAGPYRKLGNWRLGEILMHLALAGNKSIDGTIERGGLFLFWSGLKRLIDIAAALVFLPISAFLSVIYRIYGTITGRVRFFREDRIWNGHRIQWPRGVRHSGDEVSDCVKYRLFALILSGRLSFIGPPPALPSWSPGEVAGGKSMFRAGVTGAWRIAPGSGWRTAMENEMLEMQNWSFNREIVLLVKSIPALLGGRYPDWFYNDRRSS